MNRYIVLRESGASEFLLIDKETRRVVTLSGDQLATVETLPETGQENFKGIDMAVVLMPHPDVTSRMFYRQDKVAA